MNAHPRRRSHVLLSPRVWAVALALTCAACAPSADGDAALAPAPNEFTSALGSGPWAFHYITAAVGNSWTRWWTFSPDGTVTRTTEAWVVDWETGESTYPVRAETGTWTLTGGRHVEVVAEGPAEPVVVEETAVGVRRTWRFAAVVYDAAPRLVTHPTPSLSGVDGGLSTRAFVQATSGEWVDERSVTVDGHPELDSSTRVVVGITPALGPENMDEPCEFAIAIEVAAGAESASAALDVPCVRVSDPSSGWYAAGSVSNYIYRYNVIEESGALEGHSGPLRTALHEAMVMVLAMHEEQPDVAVHPHSSDEALGWYLLSKQPAPTMRR